eukprot:9632228-Alexandrium_andersonii.AAC.1
MDGAVVQLTVAVASSRWPVMDATFQLLGVSRSALSCFCSFMCYATSLRHSRALRCSSINSSMPG